MLVRANPFRIQRSGYALPLCSSLSYRSRGGFNTGRVLPSLSAISSPLSSLALSPFISPSAKTSPISPFLLSRRQRRILSTILVEGRRALEEVEDLWDALCVAVSASGLEVFLLARVDLVDRAPRRRCALLGVFHEDGAIRLPVDRQPVFAAAVLPDGRLQVVHLLEELLRLVAVVPQRRPVLVHEEDEGDIRCHDVTRGQVHARAEEVLAVGGLGVELRGGLEVCKEWH
ncbi:hypothetical protein BU26DRAFT_597475, partial [Trematosphaeria pertusa]